MAIELSNPNHPMNQSRKGAAPAAISWPWDNPLI
ncbi:hypothetical protein M2110_005920 [Paenibacillus sp. PastF-4]|nr:hypothetical protein [Paenibacillus sp. PastF-4]